MVVVGVLLVWAARRESKTEKLIKQRLAELKASGEPITTDDLANRFPDPTPANDALPIYAAAFAIATNNRVPTATPIVAGNFFPARQPIDANVMTQLIAFCEVTAAIATALPTNVPADATFPMHWSLGFTNRKTGIGVNFLAARSLSHTISAHAIAAAERGDSEAAAQFIVQGFRFNHALPYAGGLVQHMIRHALDNQMCDVTERALNRAHFSDEQLERISKAIYDERSEDLRDCFRVERCMMIFYFQWAKSGASEDLMAGQNTRPVWERVWEQIKTRRPLYTDDDYLRYLQLWPAGIDWTKEPQELQAQVQKNNLEYALTINSRFGSMVLGPSLGKAVTADFEGRAKIAALKAAISVEQYRLSHNGVLPTTPLPRDPIVPQPLRLKALPTGFMVYSVGSDGVDNGGVTRTNSVQTNYDITFCIER